MRWIWRELRCCATFLAPGGRQHAARAGGRQACSADSTGAQRFVSAAARGGPIVAFQRRPPHWGNATAGAAAPGTTGNVIEKMVPDCASETNDTAPPR